MAALRCTRCALDPDSRSLGDDAEFIHNGESLCRKHLYEEG